MTSIPSSTPQPLVKPDVAPNLRAALAIEKIALLLPVTEASQSGRPGLDNLAIQQGRADSVGARPAEQPAQPSGSATGATRETLSLAARIVLDLARSPDASAPRSTGPIMAAPPGGQPVATVVQALRGAIEGSGLFYESHLKEWVDGSRPLAQLREEPQGALPGQPAAARAGSAPPEIAPGWPRALPPPQLPAPEAASPQRTANGAQTGRGANGEPLPGPAPGRSFSSEPTAGTTTGPGRSTTSGPQHLQRATLAYQAMSASGDAASFTQAVRGTNVNAGLSETPAVPGAPALAPLPREAIPTIHPDSAGLVLAQLETLASRQLHWTGEVWPGTKLDWSIAQEQDGDGSAPDVAEAGPWSTRLVLDLPALGKVEATLRLGPAGIDARLRAPSPEVAGRLSADAAAFASRLTAAGLLLAALSVQAQPQPATASAQEAVPS